QLACGGADAPPPAAHVQPAGTATLHASSAPPAPPPPSAPGLPLPPEWFLSGGARDQFDAALDVVVKHGPAPSLRLRPKPTYSHGYGTVMQIRPAAPHLGKRMRFTALAKGEGVVGRGDIWLRVQAPES